MNIVVFHQHQINSMEKSPESGILILGKHLVIPPAMCDPPADQAPKLLLQFPQLVLRVSVRSLSREEKSFWFVCLAAGQKWWALLASREVQLFSSLLDPPLTPSLLLNPRLQTETPSPHLGFYNVVLKSFIVGQDYVLHIC